MGAFTCPFVLFFLSNWIQMFPLPANEAFLPLCCRCIVRPPKCEGSCKEAGCKHLGQRGKPTYSLPEQVPQKTRIFKMWFECWGDWLSDAPDARPSSYPWLSRSSQVVSLSSAAAWSGSPTDWMSLPGASGWGLLLADKLQSEDVWLIIREQEDKAGGLGVSLSGSRGIIRPHPSSVRKPSLSLWQE